MSRPRDSRAAVDAASRFATEHAISGPERAALLARVESVCDWLVTLRKTVAVTRRARTERSDPDLRLLRDKTIAIARAHGELWLKLVAGGAVTREGLPLPVAVETDLDVDLFAPLYEAGVDVIAFSDQASEATLAAIVDVLATPQGVRDGDPFVKVWLERGSGLRLEHCALLGPDVVPQLVALSPEELTVSSVVAAFAAVSPTPPQRDARAHFTADTLVALAPHGVDPGAARATLFSPNGGTLPQGSAAGAAAFRALAEHSGDLETRVDAARNRHLRKGA